MPISAIIKHLGLFLDIKNLPILFVILLLAAFANVINDIFDLKIDIDNKIKRPIASKKIKTNISFLDFDELPSWTIIENKEIKISSSEIRNQREKLRGKN